MNKQIKKSFIIILIAVIIISPITVLAYGGGIPPVIGIGPRIDDARDRVAQGLERVRVRLELVVERVNSLFKRLRQLRTLT